MFINIIGKVRIIATAVAMIAAAIIASENDPILGSGIAAAALSSLR